MNCDLMDSCVDKIARQLTERKENVVRGLLIEVGIIDKHDSRNVNIETLKGKLDDMGWYLTCIKRETHPNREQYLVIDKRTGKTVATKAIEWKYSLGEI